MKTKSSFLCLLVLGLAATAVEAATNQLQLTPAYINQLVEEMRTNHPALLASRARSEAAASGVRAVRTWEDPVVRVGAMAGERMKREDDGDLFYGVEQKLPLFGKADQRKMAATAHAVEIAREDAHLQTLRSELAKALFRAALADEVIATGEQDLAWLETTIKVVEPAYQSGAAKLMDLLTLQNEQSKRAEQLKTQHENRAQTGLALNRRLNRELTSVWPLLQLPMIADDITYSERLINLALRNEPRLKTLREEIRAAESAVTVARKERLPDVSVGFENRNYGGNGDWRQSEFMLGLNIPLGSGGKSRAAIRREEQKHAAAEFEARDFEQFVREEVHGLTLKISAARREALLYHVQIIPRSDQALASAKSMFESGGGALRDVLDARRMLLEGKLMHARAVAEQYEMLSELVLCCGLGDLEALQMISSQVEKPNGKTAP